MCLKCHSGLSNDIIREQLLTELINKNFTKWNITSINHILIIISGYNGNKNKILATQLLNEYILYLKQHNDKEIYSYEKLINIINLSKTNKIVKMEDIYNLLI